MDIPMNARYAYSIAVLLPLLAACQPEPPSKERPPEPQASAAANKNTQLRDAIQAPQDKARATEDQTLQAADAQRAAIDAQTQ